MKKVFSLSLILFMVSLFMACKDTNANFSPGVGDARITGTWRLVERRFQKDSLYFIYTTQRDSVKKDSVYVPTIDTLRSSRDTTFFTTKRYAANPPQTLTFDSDGKLSTGGTEMTYYSSTKYYKVDTTYPDSLLLNLYIYTNRANVAFQQGLAFRGDTLTILPRCDQPCYSKFLRVQ